MRFSSNSAAAWVDSYWTFKKYANPDRTRPSKIRLNIQAVCWTSSVFRWRREDSIRPMSNRSMRWFIIVDGAKKRKDLARPGTQSATGTDTKFLGEDGHLAQDIMYGASVFSA